MPALLNQMHERFCLSYADGILRGLTQGQIYLTAGGKAGSKHSADVLGSRMLKRPEVIQRLAELGAPAAKKAGIQAEELIETFQDIGKAAKEDKQYSAANRSHEIIARMSGHLVDRSEIHASIALESLDTVEDVALAILADVGSVDAFRAYAIELAGIMETIAADQAKIVPAIEENAPAASARPSRISEADRAIEAMRPTRRR